MDQMQRNLLPRDGGRVVIERANRPGRPSGVICSLATGRHRELLAQSAPSMAAYAQHHGWSVVLSSERLGERPPSWTKIALIQELLARYDLVWWIDADAIIVDLDRDILAEIGDAADIWFARHPQERNPHATVLNAGICLVRASPFATKLLAAIWAKEEFEHHNWWENAALLDLLGYSLDAPYAKLRESTWDARVGELDLAWNSVPGYCESPTPAINHHARSDHDDFGVRLTAMEHDRLTTIGRFPALFEHVRTPSSAGVDGGPRRTHDFDGLTFGEHPSVEHLLALIDRLDTDNESQRLRLIEVFDQLEETVTALVDAQRRSEEIARSATDEESHQRQLEQLSAELVALRNTKLFRVAQPLRSVYARVRGRRRG